jgi:hypothetical protein
MMIGMMIHFLASYGLGKFPTSSGYAKQIHKSISRITHSPISLSNIAHRIAHQLSQTKPHGDHSTLQPQTQAWTHNLNNKTTRSPRAAPSVSLPRTMKVQTDDTTAPASSAIPSSRHHHHHHFYRGAHPRPSQQEQQQQEQQQRPPSHPHPPHHSQPPPKFSNPPQQQAPPP